MMSNYTPDTEGVRGMYLLGFEGARQPWESPTISPKVRKADFDRWLAKHDEKVARDAVKAERLRVLGLLENAERMHNLYRTVWWNLSPHPSGRRAARLMTYLLRAELMGSDDE
jgi:hypothetical protein